MKRLLFSLFALLSTTIVWGQATLSGSGTSSSPYQIKNASDWETFAEWINSGTNVDKYYKLTTDIGPVTAMVGVWDATEANRKPFSGNFTGDGHVLTVNYSNSTAGAYTAPFVCTSGATIKLLTVAGDINTTVGNAAGLIGANYGSTTKVQNTVTISVNITDGANGSAGDNCAGVAVDGTSLEISSCVYNGTIKAGNNSAGFLVTGSSSTKINSSLFAPAAGSSITAGQNFIANDTYNRLATSYYTLQVSSSTQGLRAYTSYGDVPSTGFWLKKQLNDNNDYFVSGTGAITGLNSPYYQNNIQNGGFTYIVTFTEPDVNTATNVDVSYYTAVITDRTSGAVVSDIGEIPVGSYTLTLTGNENLCKGTLTADFEVVASALANGSGTESDPYQIGSASDWNAFANAVNSGHSFIGEYLKLTNDITLNIDNSSESDVIAGVMTSTNNGTEDKWFSGTFDGDWKTIMFNVGTEQTAYTPVHNYSPSAPFRVIDGATIKNLTVDGTIRSTKKYNSGLVGFAYNTKTGNANNITNCTSNITIDCSGITGNNPDCSSSGFVAENKNGNIYFTNCVFNGSIDKGNLGTAQKSAGFVSYNNGTKVYFTNCTMAGTINLTSNIATFYRVNASNAVYKEAYYINDYSNGAQGVQALTTAPTDAIVKKYTANNTIYYVPSAVVTGLEATTYTYIDGQPITLTPPTVEYYGRTLTRGTDYVITIDGTQVDGDLTISTAGDHTVAIEGTGLYGGSQSVTIKVINFDSWAVLQEVLADASNGDRVITLNSDISPAESTDIYLEVKGNVVLNLNGHTIDRHLIDSVAKGQVFRVNSGANLTINGPGTITGGFNYANGSDIDGGGIYNMGHLVLNDVTIDHNKCVKEAWGSTSNKGRGGGIYSGSGSSLVINGGSILSNTARGGGGGVYSEGANPFTMTGVHVEGNESESKGGGIRVKTATNAIAYLTDCTIHFNQVSASASQGGGVYLENGELVMTRCEIKGNQATMQGAGFYSIRGKTTAIECDISYNGTYFEHADNHGAGVCLYDNKGNDHSIFIMDGGTIEANNCNHNGGGIYVYDGAVFQVKGSVRILENYQGELFGDHSYNNTYVDGTSVIEVVGPLAEDAYIVITPHDNGGIYVTFAEGVSTADALSHFALDNDEYRLILIDGNIEAYELYPWNVASTWNGTIATDLGGNLPTASNSVTINRAVKIPSGCMATANTITLGEYGEIVINDGGQLIHSNDVIATLQKGISAYNVLVTQGDSKTDGWYTIASPVTGDLNTECVALGEYDLYLYNEPTHYWWNAEGNDHGFSTLSNGKGYLYANEENVTLNFTGSMQATTNANVSFELSYTENAGNLRGYNLVGNPFTRNLTSSDAIMVGDSPLTSYMYVSNGNEVVPTTLAERDILPGEGFFVQATATNQNLVFNYSGTPSGVEPNNIAFLRLEAGDDSFMDRAYVQFGEGNTLHKMTINNEVPHLAIQQGSEDYASATVEADHGAIPVSFKAAKSGSYTLTVGHEGMEMDYLHLVDNLTGADTDLLSEPSYTFTASDNDYASRFRLVYSARTSAQPATDENFAFIDNGQIIVTGVVGDATIQVIDVMGRVVVSRDGDVSGNVSTSGMTAGVYVLRLIQGDNVRTQKIVIE